MRLNLSLKRYFFIIMGLIILSLVVAYSLLARSFFIQGIDTYIVSQMYKSAERMQQHPKLEHQALVLPNHVWVTRSWEALPDSLQQVPGLKPTTANELVKHEVSEPRQPGHILYFAMKIPFEFASTLYVVRAVDPSQVPKIGFQHASKSFDRLNLLGLAILLGLFALLYWVVRSIGKPVEALGLWARQLDENQVKQSPPDFRYPELNELAKMIQQGLETAHHAIEREHRFLRHASHELRTPIAVVRNNVELLQKLHPDAEPSEKAILERLYRAGMTMTDLTQTLLWLNREDMDSVLFKEEALDELVRESADNLAYLLANKPVALLMDTAPYRLNVAATPCRIVLSNLIRNAYQYTWSGEIVIRQKGSEIQIENPLETQTEPMQTDLGFGLGLNLTRQLCQQYGWRYTRTQSDDRYLVAVDFHTIKQETNR